MPGPETDRPSAGAVGGGAGQPRRLPLDLDRLALEPAGSPGFGLVERHEGRAALAARVAAGLVKTMPAYLSGGPAVAWLSAAMTARGFSTAEIRAALPSAGIPAGRDRRDRKGSASGVGRRRPSMSAESNPSPDLER
jgi:hypothetical protein